MKISYLLTKKFWAETLERASKTFAQTLGGLLVGDAATSALSVNWEGGLVASGVAALASVLTSVASGKVGPEDSPSLV